MSTDFIKRHKYLLILLVIGMVFILWLVAYQPNKVMKTKPKAIASSVYAHSKDGDTLHAITDTGFIDINLKDNSTTQHFLAVNPATLSEITWIGSSVLFQNNPTESTIDDLTQYAANQGVSPATPHWWRYDTAAKKLEVVKPQLADQCIELRPIRGSVYSCVKMSGNFDSSTLHVIDTATDEVKEIAAIGGFIRNCMFNEKQNALYFISQPTGKAESLMMHNLTTETSDTLHTSEELIRDYLPYDNGVAVIDATAIAQKNTDFPGDENYRRNIIPAYARQTLLVKQGENTQFQKQLGKNGASLYSDNGTIYVSKSSGEIYEIGTKSIEQLYDQVEAPDGENGFFFNSQQKRYVMTKNTLYYDL